MKHSSRLYPGILIIIMIGLSSCHKDKNTQTYHPVYDTYTDPRDNQEYLTVTIGTQTWFAENLKYETKSGSWYYGDDPANGAVYGRLYTWQTAIDASPPGWHLPDKTEWSTLIYNYLGGFKTAGGELKEQGFGHWASPNYGATNSTGFTALPGGYSNYECFNGMYETGSFWSSTELDNLNAYKYDLSYNSTVVEVDGSYKSEGLSVRCIKD